MREDLGFLGTRGHKNSQIVSGITSGRSADFALGLSVMVSQSASRIGLFVDKLHLNWALPHQRFVLHRMLFACDYIYFKVRIGMC